MEYHPFWPGYIQILRQLLVLRIVTIWKWYPWLLLQSTDDHCSVNTAYEPESSFTISSRSTTRSLYFWCFASNSAFFKWHMPISEAKWTFATFVLTSSITSFLLLTFVRFHAKMFSNFSHSLSTAAHAAKIFMSWCVGINLCTNLYCCSELSPFLAIWSSWWFGKDSPICSLVDSLASKIHASVDLALLDLSPVTLFWLFLLILRGMSGATGVANFLRAFLILNSLSSGSMN